VGEVTGAGRGGEPILPKLRGVVGESLAGGYLAVCPGAEYGPAKRWGAERFAAAAGRLRQVLGVEGVVILGGAKDEGEAGQVARRLGSVARQLAGRTSFEAFLRWLAGARLVLCNDSGAMHLAALLGVPSVAVFGSTEPALTGPLGGRVAVVREHVGCSPCFLRECPLDLRCMEQVEVERVVRAGLEVAG
ncbi:MAG: glycosyltransferase family 9 protein, partial [Verrucomicrobiia bacterium]